jgi:spore germination protein GerM
VTRRAIVATVACAGGAFVLWWLLFSAVPRWFRGSATPTATPAASPTAAAQRKITATLFFTAEDGLSLVPVQREVPLAEPVVEQARQIILAQIAAPSQPLATTIPSDTKLRAIYLSDRGDLFVDFSPELTARHTGGSLDELFTVYAIVNAATVNLPAITRVQILIDGKEVDTLAGHVDLRNPLAKNLTWVRSENPS